MYFLGIDGGGSKTHCIIGDEKGNIFTEGFGGPANYQTIGLEKTHISIMTAVHRALDKLNLKIEDIGYAVLGLAGADTAEDISALEQICKEIFKETSFKILNECWITLRTGNAENWGVVSICGIAHWTMGRNKEGDQSELRNMDYELGNRGGGREINARGNR
ncbi:MAG: BadF/BadG/BcrA/BcrD ATPase family protein [Cellulosilyticaceae bacterium]